MVYHRVKYCTTFLDEKVLNFSNQINLVIQRTHLTLKCLSFIEKSECSLNVCNIIFILFISTVWQQRCKIFVTKLGLKN